MKMEQDMTTAIISNVELAQTPQTAKDGLFVRFSEWLRFNRSLRTTIRELSNLSDRELDDLNIARCDIPAIALEAASNSTR